MAGQQSTSALKKDNGNGLLLYQYYPSYFCQKVVFALNEKKIKHKSRIVDIYRGEQFEPWFIKLNPKSEVPVLQDGVKIIPDSRRIIDYLEDNFSNGNTPRLIPEKGTPQYHMMERLRDMLDNLPIQLLTFGCILNPELTGKINLSPQEIKMRRGAQAAQDSLLRDLCEKYRDFGDYYLVRIKQVSKMYRATKDPEEVGKAILDIEYALNTCEKELATHDGDKKNWWLCSDKFTVADISLGVLLHRVHVLGLSDNIFRDATCLPYLQEYWARIKMRDSFRRTVHQGGSLLKSFRCLDARDQMLVGVGGAAVVLATAALATFFVVRSQK